MVRNMLKQIKYVALIICVTANLCTCGTANDSSITSHTKETTVSNYITENVSDNSILCTKVTQYTTEVSTEKLSSSVEEEKNVLEESSDASVFDQTPDIKAENGMDNNIALVVEELFVPIIDMGGRYSAKAIMSDGSEIIAVGDYNEKMVSASLIKLYVAAVVYENKESIVSQESYDGETDDLVDIMISQSDNNACNTLVTRLGDGDPVVGMKKVNVFCDENGFEETEMNRLMLDFNGLENYTSAEDCCKILKEFYDNKYKGSEKIKKYMKHQIIRTKIPAGIPDDVVVANKTGELSTVENDSAIIYSKNFDYILCVMINDIQDTYAAQNDISHVSEIIYAYLCK